MIWLTLPCFCNCELLGWRATAGGVAAAMALVLGWRWTMNGAPEPVATADDDGWRLTGGGVDAAAALAFAFELESVDAAAGAG